MPNRVLIVEDEDSVRSIIAEVFRAEGMEVKEAKNGKEALELFEIERPDIVVLDVLMPEIDGLQVCQAIRKMPEPLNQVPIIMLTAIDTKLGERIGLETGATLYLTKPFSLHELRRTVLEILSGEKR